MQSFNNLVASSLNEVLEFLGEPIIIGNKTVLAVVNAVELEEELMEGGILKKRGITAVCAKLPTLPAIGSKILFQGKSFRISNVNEDSAGVEIVAVTDSR